MNKNIVFCVSKTFLLLGTVIATPGVTFDFRSTLHGGNVGDSFNQATSAEATVEGLMISGAVDDFNEFFYSSGSADLGIGVNSEIAGDRRTQIDIGESVAFSFDQMVEVTSVTFQVFFLTADDGMGGPVAQENDAVSLTLGGETVVVASPMTYSTGDPSTYTIDFSSLGFADTILDYPSDSEDIFRFSPVAGDGVRLRSITVSAIPEPSASLALFGLGLCGFAGLRRVMKKKGAA